MADGSTHWDLHTNVSASWFVSWYNSSIEEKQEGLHVDAFQIFTMALPSGMYPPSRPHVCKSKTRVSGKHTMPRTTRANFTQFQWVQRPLS